MGKGEQAGDEVSRATMRFYALCTDKPKGWREEARKVYAEAPEEAQAHIRELQEAFIVGGQEDEWPLRSRRRRAVDPTGEGSC